MLLMDVFCTMYTYESTFSTCYIGPKTNVMVRDVMHYNSRSSLVCIELNNVMSAANIV